MVKIAQIGLTTNSQKDLNDMEIRVDKFNRRVGRPTAVELTVHEVPEAERKTRDMARWRLLFEFESRDCAWAFWTGNQYR